MRFILEDIRKISVFRKNTDIFLFLISRTLEFASARHPRTLNCRSRVEKREKMNQTMKVNAVENTAGRAKSRSVQKLASAGICLAISLVLPFITGQIPEIGSMLSPMHIPVLLCGFICGWQYGFAVGAVAPILRYLLFGMPPIFPTGIAMAFELAAYGACAGILYQKMSKKVSSVYVSLIGAMLIGRMVWGVARFLMALLFGVEFSFAAFLGGAFLTAVPGIICHIALIPVLVIGLRKAGCCYNE